MVWALGRLDYRVPSRNRYLGRYIVGTLNGGNRHGTEFGIGLYAYNLGMLFAQRFSFSNTDKSSGFSRRVTKKLRRSWSSWSYVVRVSAGVNCEPINSTNKIGT